MFADQYLRGVVHSIGVEPNGNAPDAAFIK